MRPSPSEQGIHKFLEQLRAPIYRTAAYRLFDKVRRRETGCRTVISELPLHRWLSFLRSGSVRMFGRGAGGGVPDAAHSPDVVLIKSLATELGVNRKTLRRAIRMTHVKPRAVVGRVRKFQLIAREDVPRIQAHLSSYLCAEAAAEVLNIQGRRMFMRFFRRAGLIKTVGVGHSLLCTSASVVGMLDALQNLAQRVHAVSSGRLIPLDDTTIYERRDSRALKELYDDLLVGRVPLYLSSAKKGIGAFAVPLDVLARVARRSSDFASRARRDPRQLVLPLC